MTGSIHDAIWRGVQLGMLQSDIVILHKVNHKLESQSYSIH